MRTSFWDIACHLLALKVTFKSKQATFPFKHLKMTSAIFCLFQLFLCGFVSHQSVWNNVGHGFHIQWVAVESILKWKMYSAHRLLLSAMCLWLFFFLQAVGPYSSCNLNFKTQSKEKEPVAQACNLNCAGVWSKGTLNSRIAWAMQWVQLQHGQLSEIFFF